MERRILLFVAPLLIVLGVLMIIFGIASISIGDWIEGAKTLGYAATVIGSILIIAAIITLVFVKHKKS